MSGNPLPRCAPSTIAPFRPGEHHADRHDRRKSEALTDRDAVRVWCAARDVRLSVTNDGHHWGLRGPGLTLEWWPSSGRVVIDMRYDRPKKAHDYKQMLEIAAKHRRRRIDRRNRKRNKKAKADG